MAIGGIRTGSGVSGEPFGISWMDSPAGASQGALYEFFVNNILGTDGRYEQFDDVSSVAAGAVTPILSYTIPAGKVFKLIFAEAGGSNIADYRVTLNAIRIARKRTNFATEMSVIFPFATGLTGGLELNAGDVLVIETLHLRPDPGDFEARIYGILEDV